MSKTNNYSNQMYGIDRDYIAAIHRKARKERADVLRGLLHRLLNALADRKSSAAELDLTRIANSGVH